MPHKMSKALSKRVGTTADGPNSQRLWLEDNKYRLKNKLYSNFFSAVKQKIVGWYRIEIVSGRHVWVWNQRHPLIGLGTAKPKLQLYHYVSIWLFAACSVLLGFGIVWELGLSGATHLLMRLRAAKIIKQNTLIFRVLPYSCDDSQGPIWGPFDAVKFCSWQ